MKKILAAILVACFSLTVVGCSGGDGDKKPAGTPTPTRTGTP